MGCCTRAEASTMPSARRWRCFFPAPFHLIRQGHIGHHIRNRSDDEAFDLYFSNESRFWKCVQLYGTLTGLFWVLIYVTNLVVLLPSVAGALPGRDQPHARRVRGIAQSAL